VRPQLMGLGVAILRSFLGSASPGSSPCSGPLQGRRLVGRSMCWTAEILVKQNANREKEKKLQSYTTYRDPLEGPGIAEPVRRRGRAAGCGSPLSSHLRGRCPLLHQQPFSPPLPLQLSSTCFHLLALPPTKPTCTIPVFPLDK
jgi:hypothetical protein